MTTEKLQHEIKKLLAEMHWTQAQAARCIHCEQVDSDNEDEIRRYEATFRKKLRRHTTPPEHLNDILKILSQQREALRLGKIKLDYIPSAHIPHDSQIEMRRISRIIDTEILSDDEICD